MSFIINAFHSVSSTYDFAVVGALIHANGTNGSTSFTDSSSNAHTVTVFGNAQVSTSSPQFGSGALLLDGAGDYIRLPHHTSLQMPTGDFTVQFWFKSAGTQTSKTLAGRANTTISSNSDISWSIRINSGGNIGAAVIDNGGTSHSVASVAMSTYNDSAWHFLELNRIGDDFNFLIDGSLLGTYTGSITLNNSSWVTSLGARADGIEGFNGRLDDIRIITGYGLNYTSNPSSEFSDSSVNVSGG